MKKLIGKFLELIHKNRFDSGFKVEKDCAEFSKKIAIDFGKWLYKNRWFHYEENENLYYFTSMWGTTGKVPTSTPEELFTKFLETYEL